MSDRPHSLSAWRLARTILAGGVNSPVRAFNSVGGTPVFFRSGRGARIQDIDGNDYIDYVGSWGPMILGHSHPKIVQAVCDQAQHALGFGAPTELENEMGAQVQNFFPNMKRVRFVNSGTEATMTAIRLARAYSQRKYIVCFAGGYHGHGDSFLGNAGSGLLTLSIKEAAGVAPELSRYTLSLPYNDSQALRQLFTERGEQIAAVIVEPIAANMNLILPESGFLESILELCRANGAVSIFDEVITGLRVHRGGAQGLFGLQPDLTVLGKIIGGGLPVGAFGGKNEIMDMLAPTGKVYQAGTLSGNPLAMRAGIETLRLLQDENLYHALNRRTSTLAREMDLIAKRHTIECRIPSICGLFGVHFLSRPARRLVEIDVARHKNAYRRLFHAMLDRGVYLAPSPFEAGFVSTAHSDEDIEQTIDAFRGSVIECFT